jgi:precorrin-2 dehydrogenase / sirohydrochlorin ferrochelatase
MSRKGNELFPVFFRLEKLSVLVVGGGFVGLEKVNAIFSNSPEAKVKLVAPEIRSEIADISASHPGLALHYKPYETSDLEGIDIVIAATSIKELNRQVWEESKARKIIVNVADTPDLCDFYMCSIVKKGDLKIGISSNGVSPTLTKRLRELLEDALPEEIDGILQNLKQIRDSLKGDFEYKVKKMNEITSAMVDKREGT